MTVYGSFTHYWGSCLFNYSTANMFELDLKEILIFLQLRSAGFTNISQIPFKIHATTMNHSESAFVEWITGSSPLTSSNSVL